MHSMAGVSRKRAPEYGYTESNVNILAANMPCDRIPVRSLSVRFCAEFTKRLLKKRCSPPERIPARVWERVDFSHCQQRCWQWRRKEAMLFYFLLITSRLLTLPRVLINTSTSALNFLPLAKAAIYSNPHRVRNIDFCTHRLALAIIAYSGNSDQDGNCILTWLSQRAPL